MSTDEQLKPRNRSLFVEDFEDEVAKWQQTAPSTGPINDYYTASKLANVDCGYAHGWDTPRFHARVKKGELLPMTPFKQVHYDGSTQGNYDCYFTTSGITKHYWIVTPGTWRYATDWRLTEDDFAPYIPENLDWLAQGAAAKIYSNGYDALTALAELALVHKLVIQSGKRLIDLLSRYKRYPRKGRLKRISSDWLAGRYGWRTLKYDLEDLYETLSKLDEVRTRYSERTGDKTSTSNSTSRQPTIGAGVLNIVTQDTVTIGMRGSCVADIVIPKFQFNPLQTGWELIPFSFVVDWFVSVGRSVAALAVVSRAKAYTASVGYEVRIERQMSLSLMTPSASFTSGTVEQTGNCSGYMHVRTPCNVSLIPQFKVRLNGFKVIDILSLVVQNLPRR